MHVFRVGQQAKFLLSRPHRQCKFRHWLLFFIVAIIATLFFAFKLMSNCSQENVTNAISKLCDLYHRNKVAGNMCEGLCSRNNFEIKSCESFHAGKELVVNARWKSEDIVLKSHYDTLEKYDELDDVDKNIFIALPVIHFRGMLRTKLNFTLRTNLSLDVVSLLWFFDFEQFAVDSREKLTAAMVSVWSLVQQHEYVLFKLFEDKHVFPKILGTCGHVYATERVSLLCSLDKCGHPKERTHPAVSLKILEFLDALGNDFHQTLHLCDVKLNHLATDVDARVKLLDADAVFFRPQLNYMLSLTNCSSHSDCAFWDCKAKCNAETHKCGEVTNNNLQVICEKLFLGNNDSIFSLRSEGLLNSVFPASNYLLEKVKQCGNPDIESDRDLRSEASNILHRKIREALLVIMNDFDKNH